MVAVIEWADKLEASLPLERLDLAFEHRSEDRRLITLHPQGGRYCQLIERWQSRQAAHADASGPAGDVREIAPA